MWTTQEPKELKANICEETANMTPWYNDDHKKAVCSVNRQAIWFYLKNRVNAFKHVPTLLK